MCVCGGIPKSYVNCVCIFTELSLWPNDDSNFNKAEIEARLRPALEVNRSLTELYVGWLLCTDLTDRNRNDPDAADQWRRSLTAHQRIKSAAKRT